MVLPDFVDLDIRFERSGRGYRAVVVNSPVGEGYEVQFRRPVNDKDLELFVLKMSRGGGMRRIETPQAAKAKELGDRLFQALFHDDLLVCLRDSLHESDRQERGLRIRLRLGATPDLSYLPWEYLYDRQFNRFLCLSDRTPVVRYPEMLEAVRPLRVNGPLRVLVVVSSPSDYPALDVEQEWTRVQEAVGDLESAGRIQLERLSDSTLSGLRRQLRRRRYHALHFIGHGGFDDSRGEGVLVFTEADGTGCWVSGERLGIDLHDAALMRLVVLNACEGARNDAADPFSGVAQSLVQQGIPAVVAMQFEISDSAAIAFAHGFYGAIADGMPIDASMGQARKDIHDISALEWATPVLYLRAPNSRIFELASDPSSEKPLPQLVPDDVSSREAAAEEQARREAEGQEQARREAEKQARREAEEQEQARREAEKQARSLSGADSGSTKWTLPAPSPRPYRRPEPYRRPAPYGPHDPRRPEPYRPPEPYSPPKPADRQARTLKTLWWGQRGWGFRSTLIAVPLVLVTTAVAVLVVWTSGLNKGSPPSPLPPGLPTQSLNATPPTTPSGSATIPSGSPRPLPGPGALLPSGPVIASQFIPQMSFSVDNGWKLNRYNSDLVELSPQDVPEGALVFARIQKIFDPSATFSNFNDAHRAGTPLVQPVPPDLVSWIQTNPRLTTASAGTGTAGQLPASVVEFSVTPGSGYAYQSCPSPCVLLFQLQNVNDFAVTGYRERLLVVQVKGQIVAIHLTAPAGQFSQLASRAERLLSSLRLQ
jgi:hypothetical protein